MHREDIIMIGASAGGIEALKEIVAGLPADLPGAVFIAVRTSPSDPGGLPQILSRARQDGRGRGAADG